ncbi:LytTR family DNA-binding domain-containing protein [Aliiglaciecola sp. 3_MG-2023]|uniref:LytTR family DNA-binding domain-containing protein n=1 Tax=Aliiglaciecola sp. 3_MG-2023 TaxID=3062644 RepID=UPI0026E28D60|nr:LytTR family DNA-binding domain-containing protein [Aliiglaciecola sp. 3_MG-2023]MDO6692002.1 LytTR family DNA-binding domain-containing protein [Aliiglaciecola sp. 3_MG-2023]
MIIILKRAWQSFSLALRDRTVLSFYLGVPLALGMFFALSQSGTEPLVGIEGHLVYWLISTLLSWQFLAIGSKLVALVLKPFKAPFIAILIAGFALGIVLWVPVSIVRDILVDGYVQEGQVLKSTSRYTDIVVTISNWTLGIGIWVSVNYFYLFVLGVSRFNYSADSKKVQRFRSWLLSTELSDEHSDFKQSRSPRLHNRLSKPGDILALIAEDHYTRVILQNREELIYIRFKDAIAEMQGQNGFQTHRSYWVSEEAAVGYSEQGHSASIKLLNDRDIPVSRSFRQAIKRQLGSLSFA